MQVHPALMSSLDQVHRGWTKILRIFFGKVTWKRRFLVLNKNGEIWICNDEKMKRKGRFSVRRGSRYRESNVTNNCIEIGEEHGDRSFIFQTENSGQCKEWLEKLKEVGGVEDESVADKDDDILYSKKYSKKISKYRKKQTPLPGVIDNFLPPPSKKTKIVNSRFLTFFSEEERKTLFDTPFEGLKLLKILDQSMNSTIYLGENKNEENVVVDMFKTSSLESVDCCRVVKRELELLQNHKHPNILKYVGCVLHGEKVGIIREFVENGCVKDFLYDKDNPRFTIPQKLRILKSVAQGLFFMEQRNIVHLNLSWEQVFLDSCFEPKIYDFGLERKLEQFIVKTYTGGIGIGGKHFHFAPEITLGGGETSRADVFSFGIMMFELLFEDFSPYGEYLEFNVSLKVALNPDYRPKIEEKLEEMKKKNEVLGKDLEKLDWLFKLMKRCWKSEIKERPTFEEICCVFTECVGKQMESMVLEDEHERVLCLRNGGFFSEEKKNHFVLDIKVQTEVGQLKIQNIPKLLMRRDL